MNYEDNDNIIYETEPGQEEVSETAPSGPDRKPRKKPRVKKKRRKKYYTLRFLILVLACVGVYFFMHSAVFTVEKIDMEETERFSLDYVKEVTGLKTGVNMFDVDLKDCEKALEEKPYVIEADVSRKLPDTINVVLEVREPVAVVKQDGKYIMLDRTGFVLEKREKLPHYTFLDGITVSDAEIGQVIKVKEEKKYQQYMNLIDEMNSADLYFRKLVIEDNGIKLYVKPELYCAGTKKNVMEGLRDGNLKAILYTLSKKDVKKGVVNVGDDKYYSFSKKKK